MKYLILDAGPIISLSMNGLLYILEKLKKDFKGEFIITPDVKFEVIDRPRKIKKYHLEALKVQELLDKGVLKLSTDIIDTNKLNKETNRILKLINSSFVSYENIKLVHKGEASCLAFSNLCNAENLIAADERTIRMICESPEALKKLMERKLHTKIKLTKNIKELEKYKFIRSAELVYMAYKKNLIPIKKQKALLDALLYAVKYKGTAITSDEIETMKKLA